MHRATRPHRRCADSESGREFPANTRGDCKSLRDSKTRIYTRLRFVSGHVFRRAAPPGQGPALVAWGAPQRTGPEIIADLARSPLTGRSEVGLGGIAEAMP